jgi:hypothetical protein
LSSFFGLCVTLSAIEEEWESIAGGALASRSVIRSYDDGVLVVAVANRSAQQDMNFKKNAIIKAISLKTSLDVKDIRTEVAPVISRRRARPAARNRGRRTEMAKGPEIDAMKAEILEQNPGIGEKLAETIACCRAGRASARNH